MERGAQPGNANATKNKPWREALTIALAQYENNRIEQGHALRAIAYKVVEQALQGDPRCIEEIGNRLDGKAAQAIVGDDEQPMRMVVVWGSAPAVAIESPSNGD